MLQTGPSLEEPKLIKLEETHPRLRSIASEVALLRMCSISGVIGWSGAMVAPGNRISELLGVWLGLGAFYVGGNYLKRRFDRGPISSKHSIVVDSLSLQQELPPPEPRSEPILPQMARVPFSMFSPFVPSIVRTKDIPRVIEEIYLNQESPFPEASKALSRYSFGLVTNNGDIILKSKPGNIVEGLLGFNLKPFNHSGERWRLAHESF